MKEFFEKYSALSTNFLVLVSSLIMYYIFYQLLSLQFLMPFMLGVMSIIQLLMSRKYNLSNKSKLVYIATLVICVIGYFDLVYTEPTYELSDDNIEMVRIADYYIIYVENKKLVNIYKDSIIFDNNNPLKAYKMIKTDRFGVNFVEATVIKSYLMDNYILL